MADHKHIPGWNYPFSFFIGMFSVFVYGYFFVVYCWLSAWLLGLPDMEGMEKFQQFFPCRSIDTAPGKIENLQPFPSLFYNILLTFFWGFPHSWFARSSTKSLIGEASRGEVSVYRSMYVLYASAALHVVMYFWQDVTNESLWTLEKDHALHFPLLCINVFGVLYLLTSTFAIDHFELFGVLQGTAINIYDYLGLSIVNDAFTIRVHYSLSRHPIMFGFLLMFWSTPSMTYTRFVFASLWSVYIVIAVGYEEGELQKKHPEYVQYVKKTPKFCPFSNVFQKAEDHKKDE